LGPVRAYGIEGSGSHGAGLSRSPAGNGHTVVEVNRPDRQIRHRRGKSDTADAEGAARLALSGQAKAVPKSGSGEVEMIRHLRTARDTAATVRTQAMQALKALIIGAPAALREQLGILRGKMTLLRHCAFLRPGLMTSTTASAKLALRDMARRWLVLDEEIRG
jgi:transposase